MIKDVTLGRYYPVKSSLHTLDPRTKLLGLFVYIIFVFISNDFTSLFLCFSALVLLMALSNVPLKYVIQGLKPIFVIILITDLYNILFVDDGLKKAIITTLRMIEVVWGSNVLCLTTKPKDIATGLEKSLGFLKKIHLPVHDFATMIMIAFRFIPILSTEAVHIMEAQKARGANFENGNPIQRAKALLPIVIPLFASAFRKADSLAIAMDSRLYGTSEPSVLHSLQYEKNDIVSYLVIFIFALLCILAKVFPWHLN